MTSTTEHNYDSNDKCKNCELSKEQIEDRKITHCKSKKKIIQNTNNKSTKKKYI